jgi:hypothetical protein
MADTVTDCYNPLHPQTNVEDSIRRQNMIYSRFPREPRVWTQLPWIWKFAVASVITLITGSMVITWLGGIYGYTGYWFPILLTPVWAGAMIILIGMVTERRRFY